MAHSVAHIPICIFPSLFFFYVRCSLWLQESKITMMKYKPDSWHEGYLRMCHQRTQTTWILNLHSLSPGLSLHSLCRISLPWSEAVQKCPQNTYNTIGHVKCCWFLIIIVRVLKGGVASACHPAHGLLVLCSSPWWCFITPSLVLNLCFRAHR